MHPLDPAPSAAPSHPADAVLSVRRLNPRAIGCGSWASGTVAGFAYEALVFPAHAADPLPIHNPCEPFLS